MRLLGEEEKQAFMENAREESFKFIKKSTTQLYVVDPQRDRPIPNGSGVLIEVSGQKCILTAAHVLLENGNVESPYAEPGIDSDDLVYLNNDNTKFHLPEDLGGLKLEEHDLAILAIDSEVSELFKNKHFIDLRQIDPIDDGNRNNHYAVAGFPGSRTNVRRDIHRVEHQFFFSQQKLLTQSQLKRFRSLSHIR